MQARTPCEALRVVAALAVLSLNAAQYPRLTLRSASLANFRCARLPPERGGRGVQCYALCNAGSEALCAVKRWALCNGARYAALRAVHRFMCAALEANAIVHTLWSVALHSPPRGSRGLPPPNPRFPLRSACYVAVRAVYALR